MSIPAALFACIHDGESLRRYGAHRSRRQAGSILAARLEREAIGCGLDLKAGRRAHSAYSDQGSRGRWPASSSLIPSCRAPRKSDRRLCFPFWLARFAMLNFLSTQIRLAVVMLREHRDRQTCSTGHTRRIPCPPAAAFVLVLRLPSCIRPQSERRNSRQSEHPTQGDVCPKADSGIPAMPMLASSITHAPLQTP